MQPFVWTKMGVESDEALQDIVKRKEAERLHGLMYQVLDSKFFRSCEESAPPFCPYCFFAPEGPARAVRNIFKTRNTDASYFYYLVTFQRVCAGGSIPNVVVCSCLLLLDSNTEAADLAWLFFLCCCVAVQIRREPK